MRNELVTKWMDALIDEWFRMRMLRTLSESGGDEYATFIGFHSDMEFHLDFGAESDREGIENMASVVGAEVNEEDHGDEFRCYSFRYRGFKFFALDRKETE